MKEAYDKMSSKTKQFIEVSHKDVDTKRILEATLKPKQEAINVYLDQIAMLKQVLAETERVVGNGKRDGYHQVPPPMMENYCRRKFEGVEMALNIKLKTVQNQIDQLPDCIDVTYRKSDVCELELVNDVVEKVFDEENQTDSTKTNRSNSQIEDEESFTRIILKNFKIRFGF
ncbi:hypothetical protein Hanom_Chr06g00535781 [Helianthus anomalus]